MLLKKLVGVLDEVDFVELRFLQVVRRRIEEKGMTHQGVARLAGLHTSVVGAWLAGVYPLSFKMAYRICKAVGIDFNPKIRKMKDVKRCVRKRKTVVKTTPSGAL